jgi:hypothetical protein
MRVPSFIGYRLTAAPEDLWNIDRLGSGEENGIRRFKRFLS